MLIDCHTHLNEFPSNELQAILQRARGCGVTAIVAAGTTLESSQDCIKVSEAYQGVFAGVGIHPMEATTPLEGSNYQYLRELASSSPLVVFISEVGLDFSQGSPDTEIQYQVFRKQIQLAKEVQLPIVFHSRDNQDGCTAPKAALKVLRQERGWEVGGVMHYFQGDWSVAEECIDMGFLVSFGKPILRHSYLKEIAGKLPIESIVLETDSYPQPFKKVRSKWTEPKDVVSIAQELASIKGLTLEKITEVTSNNLINLLRRLGAEGKAKAIIGPEERV